MIREYAPEDRAALAAMLDAEDIPRDGQRYDTLETYVCHDDATIKGFFSITYHRDHPCLTHFCVAKDHRDARTVREMAKGFEDIVRKHGFSAFFAHATFERPDVKKAIEYYWKTKPYAEANNRHWYFIRLPDKEVTHGK